MSGTHTHTHTHKHTPIILMPIIIKKEKRWLSDVSHYICSTFPMSEEKSVWNTHTHTHGYISEVLHQHVPHVRREECLECGQSVQPLPPQQLALREGEHVSMTGVTHLVGHHHQYCIHLYTATTITTTIITTTNNNNNNKMNNSTVSYNIVNNNN